MDEEEHKKLTKLLSRQVKLRALYVDSGAVQVKNWDKFIEIYYNEQEKNFGIISINEQIQGLKDSIKQLKKFKRDF